MQENQIERKENEKEQPQNPTLSVPDQYENKNQQQATSSTRWELKRIVRRKDIAFIIFVSGLSLAAGLILLLLSTDTLQLSALNIFKISFAGISVNLLLLAMGVLLIASPFFLNLFVVQALRHERDLRIRAQKRTREAQLLQDIMTHDIRNYNQVSQLSAELLGEELQNNNNVKDLVQNLLGSIEASTLLVDRAKMLGKVISDQGPELSPINVLETIQHALSIVEQNYPQKNITGVIRVGNSHSIPLNKLDSEHSSLKVLADNLLDEVFLNIFTNSAKYTEGTDIFLSIEIDQEYLRDLKANTWKISIADMGKGIPEELMPKLFSRYLSGSKSSGLGLSIVHALVVERFYGKIKVQNRNPSASLPANGTIVNLWLRKA
jgi:signal transduction histidine kinase